MSVKAHIHLFIMINYILKALTEAIFHEVKSNVRDDGTLLLRDILLQYHLLQIM